MSYSVFGTDITLTRGDTFKSYVNIHYKNGTKYEIQPGDVVKFIMKRSWSECAEVLIEKLIPTDTLLLQFDPQDTEDLPLKTYVYKIKLIFANQDVDTFISGELELTEEG